MKKIAANGAELTYSEFGPADGTPVVLSHSLFFNHTMFDDLARELADNGYRVIAYDHRGQGGSTRSPEAEQTADNLTVDAAALITNLGLGKVHFVGNSLGGFVALRLAARYPELLLSVSAVATSAEEEYALPELGPLYEELSTHGGANAHPTIMWLMFGDTALASQSETVTRWAEFMKSLDPSIGAASYGVISRGRILEELEGCAVPLLVIAGDEDHVYPAPISTENIANAAGGRAVVVPGCGHSVSLENPRAVAGLLLDHFSASQVERQSELV